MQKKKIKCPRDGCLRVAIVSTQYGILPCQKCQDKDNIPLSRKPHFTNKAQAERIRRQWDRHLSDIEQPFMGKDQKPNPDYFKIHPEQVKDYGVESELSKL